MTLNAVNAALTDLQAGAPLLNPYGSMTIRMKTRKVYLDGTVFTTGNSYSVVTSWGKIAVENGWASDTSATLPDSPILRVTGVEGRVTNPLTASRNMGIVSDSIGTRNRYQADTSTSGNYSVLSFAWFQYANAIMKSAWRLQYCAGDSNLTINQVGALIAAQAAPSNVQHLILSVGINDIRLVDTTFDTGDTIFARYMNLANYFLSLGITVGLCEFFPTSSTFLISPACITAFYRFNQLVREAVKTTANTVLVPFFSKGPSDPAIGYAPLAGFTTDGLHPNNYGALYAGAVVAGVYSQYVLNDYIGSRTADSQNFAQDPATPANSVQFATTNTVAATTGGWGAGATLTGGSTRPTGFTLYAQGNGMNLATSVVAPVATEIPAQSAWFQLVISGTTSTSALFEVDGGVFSLASLGLAVGDWIEAFWEVNIASPVGIYSCSPGLFFSGAVGSGVAGASIPSVVRTVAKGFAAPFDVVPAGSLNLDLSIIKSVDIPMIKIPTGTTGLRLHFECSMISSGAVSGTVKVRNPMVRKVTNPPVGWLGGYATNFFTIPG